jgi:hypothetical protein
MNYKALVKQTEKQITAKNNIAKAVAKEQSEILLDFAKDIFEYLLFINDSKDFRFSAEPHYSKGNKTNPLIEERTKIGSKIPYVIESAQKDIKENKSPQIRTNGMSYFFGSVVIKLHINENFIPSVSYETVYLGTVDKHNFTDKEEFVKSFTEFLIKHRK